MTQQQLVPSSYNNRSLFSDFYLDELVAEDPHWQRMAGEAWELRQKVANILEEALPGLSEDTPEAEVERRLIRPVLTVLGHHFYVQKNVRTPEGQKYPDYALFPSEKDRVRAESQKDKDAFYKGSIAVGEAKRWDRPLDRRIKGPGDPFTNHNPSYQIDFYLRSADKRWGILTNGRLWRLYQRDLSYRLDVYYEVNLAELVKADDQAFLYFAAFFCRDAFVADATGELFLDRAYGKSTEYAASLGDELRKNVYEALRLLTEGLLELPDNSMGPADLELIRENAFTTIYRLLFILYAESPRKGEFLLPMDNPTYRDSYSLRSLVRDIVDRLDASAGLSPTQTQFWSRLLDLFRLVNNGDAYLRVPAYDGGLFDDSKHPFLTDKRVGDSYLARAIDKLARVENVPGRTGSRFVTYSDLGVRELGSIYEGLLEHQPRIAQEPMVVIKDGKRDRVVPEREAPSKKTLTQYDVGQVYLTLHRGERKATGSYYTPGYIVTYIVRNTLGSLIDEMRQTGKDLLDETEGILSLKILDPAMGSGHFLVEATDFLARALVEALAGDSREMDEDDIRWARREIVERCIYGVDVNPLAVELAKLSLWLHTVSGDKPLNFIDHHLRCGNSLIGAWMADLGVLPDPKQKPRTKTAGTTLAGHRFSSSVAAAVNSFYQIMQAPSETIEDIHRKESAYETARYALRRVEDIAEVWTSVYFGNQFNDKDGYERLLQLAESGEGDWPKAEELPWLGKAGDLAELKRFFHWELQFPEVYFDRNGQPLREPGFNAVVGNPPYVNAMELNRILSPYEKPFWKTRFASASGAYDVCLLFFELGLQLVTTDGRVGLITPNKFLSAPYALAFRDFVSSSHEMVHVADWSRVRVFEDPSVYPVVSIIRRRNTAPLPYQIEITRATVQGGGVKFTKTMHESSSLTTLPDHLWGFLLSSDLGWSHR